VTGSALRAFTHHAVRKPYYRLSCHYPPTLTRGGPTTGVRSEALRDRGPVRTDSVPARQRASEASLRQRLQSLRDENQRLREENHSLKTELALAYGQQRDARSR
jgi:hypothetical protein